MSGKYNFLLICLLIIAAIFGFLVYSSGGSVDDVFTYDCRLAAQRMNRPYAYSMGECYIQQPDGSWSRIDTNSNVP